MIKKIDCNVYTEIMEDQFIVLEYKHKPYGDYAYHKMCILNEAGKNRKVKRLRKSSIPHEVFVIGERILLQT